MLRVSDLVKMVKESHFKVSDLKPKYGKFPVKINIDSSDSSRINVENKSIIITNIAEFGDFVTYFGGFVNDIRVEAETNLQFQ